MRLFRLLTLLGVMTLWTGCGLPDSFFLVPPSVNLQSATSSTNAEFTIVGTDRGSDTGATFQGYELYYKFYGSTGDVSFNSDSTSFSTASTNIDLQQAGFHRMCLAVGTSISGIETDTTAGFASAPLINIAQIDSGDIGSSYTVKIRLNDLSVPFFAPTAPAGLFSYFFYLPPGVSVANSTTIYEEVRRFVNSPGTGCKPFASDSLAPNLTSTNTLNYDTSSDVDLYGSVLTDAKNNAFQAIVVMIYAFSYGKSIVDGTPVYSSPILLGYGGARILP